VDVINLNVCPQLNCFALDVIGLAGASVFAGIPAPPNQLCTIDHPGIGHEFDSLQSKKDEFGAALAALVPKGILPINPSQRVVRQFLMSLAPILLKLVRVHSSSSLDNIS
jgi:hypothetical protein